MRQDSNPDTVAGGGGIYVKSGCDMKRFPFYAIDSVTEYVGHHYCINFRKSPAASRSKWLGHRMKM